MSDSSFARRISDIATRIDTATGPVLTSEELCFWSHRASASARDRELTPDHRWRKEYIFSNAFLRVLRDNQPQDLPKWLESQDQRYFELLDPSVQANLSWCEKEIKIVYEDETRTEISILPSSWRSIYPSEKTALFIPDKPIPVYDHPEGTNPKLSKSTRSITGISFHKTGWSGKDDSYFPREPVPVAKGKTTGEWSDWDISLNGSVIVFYNGQPDDAWGKDMEANVGPWASVWESPVAGRSRK